MIFHIDLNGSEPVWHLRKFATLFFLQKNKMCRQPAQTLKLYSKEHNITLKHLRRNQLKQLSSCKKKFHNSLWLWYKIEMNSKRNAIDLASVWVSERVCVCARSGQSYSNMWEMEWNELKRNEECNIRLEMTYVRCSQFICTLYVLYIEKTFFESNIRKMNTHIHSVISRTRKIQLPYDTYSIKMP